jgi:F-box/leucine-rich repeat protein 10/11
MDLVSRVWPSDDFYPPKVQLYVLMSPQGCYTDFHVDMGGSSVWYHLVSGRKVFLVAPPSARNLEAFEEWASSEKQGSVFFGERGEGWRRVEMEAGDTLLM